MTISITTHEAPGCPKPDCVIMTAADSLATAVLQLTRRHRSSSMDDRPSSVEEEGVPFSIAKLRAQAGLPPLCRRPRRHHLSRKLIRHRVNARAEVLVPSRPDPRPASIMPAKCRRSFHAWRPRACARSCCGSSSDRSRWEHACSGHAGAMALQEQGHQPTSPGAVGATGPTWQSSSSDEARTGTSDPVPAPHRRSSSSADSPDSSLGGLRCSTISPVRAPPRISARASTLFAKAAAVMQEDTLLPCTAGLGSGPPAHPTGSHCRKEAWVHREGGADSRRQRTCSRSGSVSRGVVTGVVQEAEASNGTIRRAASADRDAVRAGSSFTSRLRPVSAPARQAPQAAGREAATPAQGPPHAAARGLGWSESAQLPPAMADGTGTAHSDSAATAAAEGWDSGTTTFPQPPEGDTSGDDGFGDFSGTHEESWPKEEPGPQLQPPVAPAAVSRQHGAIPAAGGGSGSEAPTGPHSMLQLQGAAFEAAVAAVLQGAACPQLQPAMGPPSLVTLQDLWPSHAARPPTAAARVMPIPWSQSQVPHSSRLNRMG